MKELLEAEEQEAVLVGHVERERLFELGARAAEVGAGLAEERAGDLERAGAVFPPKRPHPQDAASADGPHEVSGKQRAPSAARS